MGINDMELVSTRKINVAGVAGGNHEMNLEYYLVHGKACEADTYGIHVKLSKENGETESVFIPDVLPSKPEMIELIKLLYSNEVTPVCVYDVIYDSIA